MLGHFFFAVIEFNAEFSASSGTGLDWGVVRLGVVMDDGAYAAAAVSVCIGWMSSWGSICHCMSRYSSIEKKTQTLKSEYGVKSHKQALM